MFCIRYMLLFLLLRYRSKKECTLITLRTIHCINEVNKPKGKLLIYCTSIYRHMHKHVKIYDSFFFLVKIAQYIYKKEEKRLWRMFNTYNMLLMMMIIFYIKVEIIIYIEATGCCRKCCICVV